MMRETIESIITALNKVHVAGEADWNYMLASCQELRKILRALPEDGGINIMEVSHEDRDKQG